MALVIGTTDNPLHRDSDSWAIYLVDGDGEGMRIFGPDTIWACIEAKPHISAAFEAALSKDRRGTNPQPGG